MSSGHNASSSGSLVPYDTFVSWVSESLCSLLGISSGEALSILSLMESMSIDQVNDYLFGLLGESESGFDFIHAYNQKLPLVSAKPKNESIQSKSHLSTGPIPSDAPPISSIWNDSSKLFQQPHLPPEESPGPIEHVMEPPKISNRQRKRLEKQIQETKATERVGNAPPGYNGKMVCECQGTVHELLTNCISCGKIICLWEGPGPCSSCGTNILSFEEQLSQLYKTHSELSVQNAIARMQRLLNFDKTSAKRTKVHDLVSDFDTSAGMYDRWATAEERMAARERHLQKQEEEANAKKHRVMTLDLKTKKFVLENDEKEKHPEIDIESDVQRENVDEDQVNDQREDPAPATSQKEDILSTKVFANPNVKHRLRFISSVSVK